MENRLHYSIRYLLPLFFSFLMINQAQADFIWTIDEGIDTVYVNTDCLGTLDWDHPNSVTVDCDEPGCMITDFYLDTIFDSNGMGYTLADIGTGIPGNTAIFVRYFAMDNMGITATLTVRIDYLDVIGPSFDPGSLPGDVTYQCLSDAPVPVNPVGIDNCPPPGGSPTDVTVAFLGQTTQPTTCNGGTFTRTWEATDLSGNTALYTQTITISGDADDPVITGTPTSLVEQCDTANYVQWLADQEAAFMAVDNGCGIEFITNDAPASFVGLCGTIDVTFTAIDSCNNSENVVVSYTMLDDQAPVITSPAGTSIPLECNDNMNPPDDQIANWVSQLVVTDNCTAPADIVWSQVVTDALSGTCAATGQTSVMYIAQDACSNADTIILDFTITDSNAPEILLGAQDLTVACDGSGNTADLAGWLANRGGTDASDVCTEDVDIALSLQVANVTVTASDIQDMVNMQLATGCGAVVTVEFAFTDDCGNTSTSDADFTVLDTIAPVFDMLAQSVIVECDTPSIAYADWINSRGGALASDVCYTIDNSATSANWSYVMTDSVVGGCFNESIRTVEFTVTDNCGLSTTTTATYEIVDNISPTIMPTSSNGSEECGGGDDQAALNAWIDNYGGAVAFDACSDVEWTTFDYTTSTGVVGVDIMFGDVLNYPSVLANDCEWFVEVIFDVVDSCANPSSTMAEFSLKDSTDPILSGVDMTNDTLVVDCDAAIPGFPAITATDNCDVTIDITVDSTETELTCAYNFVRTRTWTAMDDCGNSDMISQVIIVQDTTKPFLATLPGDMMVSCDAVPLVPVLGIDYGAFDNCDGDIDMGVGFTETDTQGTDPDDCTFYNYSITRTWTVTDVCGNSEEYTQVISVSDTSIPTFTAPADTTIDCHVDMTPTSTGTVSGVMDVCDASPDVAYVDVITALPGCVNNYTIERTWTVTDACNNVSVAQVQYITVQDTSDPTFVDPVQNVDYVCVVETASQDSFSNWIAAYGNATATDLCSAVGDLTWFAAVPGSYDINDPLTWPGTAPGALSPAMCPSPTPGVYRSDTVDFVVYDQCDNAIAETGVFNVIDNTPPTFDQCPPSIDVDNDPGECYATVTLVAPIISDDCNSATPYTFNIVGQPIVSNTPGADSVIVNPVVLNFTGLPAAPVSASGAVTIDLAFTMLDAEEPTEYFNIFGEDGTPLGTTNNTATQCGDMTQAITIPTALFNAWAVDGMVTITLSPNIPAGMPGIFAINDICPDGSGTGGGSTVDATLNYSGNTPGGLVYSYSINGDPQVTVDPIVDVVTQLPVGTNEITYYATDCAGNESTCVYYIDVDDTELPTISCPADITYYLASNEGCGDVEMTLPIPTVIGDNCPFPVENQTQPSNLNDAMLTFSYNPNYLEFVADDKDFTFIGTAANAVGSVATFTVTITGDADEVEEYFTIYGEDGVALGTTEVGQANVTVVPEACPTPGTTTAVFEVPVATFNAWAADGSVDISAISNNTFATPPSGGASDGINPSCNPTASDDGGISTMFIDLEYQEATTYYSTTGATTTPTTAMMPPVVAPTISFDLGVTEVIYTVEDVAGNESQCSFFVSVLDTIAPIALCEPTTIFVSPSGVEDYILETYEINEGSWDENCEIATWDITPNVFTCDQAEQAIPVLLTVTDDSGNTSTCSTIISVATEQPEPDYSIGLCGDDNLNLTANPPYTPGGVIFTYEWTDPNGILISTEENPTIPGVDETDSGPYTVTIEGLTGCTAIGVVNVVINSSPNVPILEVNSNNLCTNDDIVLTTQNYSGSNVEYNWYAGIFPGGTYMATTVFPTFTVVDPAVGTNTYFVIVEIDGCVSDASFYESVTISDAPIAATNNAVINVCEGESVILGTNVTGAGYTYEWSGPNNFSSTSQFPGVITSATIGDAGTYNLVITANGCPSDAATTVVNVTPAPATPIISTAGVVCLGDDIVLSANVLGADSYTWISPTFAQVITATNQLTLTNVTMADAGNWTLFVTTAGCDSEMSAAVEVFVEPVFAVVASNDGPACNGEDIELFVNSIPGATYFWEGPAGFSSATQNPVTNAVAGFYSVTVTSSTGCTNTASTLVGVSDAPTVTAVSNTGAPCVTGSDDIFLVLTVFPPDDGTYEYLWIGPGGFSSVDSMPTLPNGTSVDNGSYTVVVTNGAGCESQALTTVVNVTTAPETPILNAPVGLCEGGTLTLTTTGYIGTSVVYTWITPLGTITTNVPSLTIPNVTSSSTGDYMMSVTVDGCTSNGSNVASIVVGSVPPTPVASSNSPVCEGEDIELFTPFIPGATYFWTGPAGFNSTLHNPVVSNAEEINQGDYTVSVIISGCESVFSVPINVAVNEAPTSAIAVNDGPICIDDSGASLTLSVTPATALPGAMYTWYDAATGALVAGPTASLNAPIVDFSAYDEGIFDFYVVTTLNGCESVNSIPTSVVLNTVPSDEAFAGPDILVCEGQAISLSGSAPSTGTGIWTQINGPIINIINPSSPTTPINGIAAGQNYTFVWTLSNGACGNYSSDEVVVSVDNASAVADAGADIDLCNQSSATLNATPVGGGVTGFWSQSAAQASLGVVINDSTDPNSEVTGLVPGNPYSFIWNLSNVGCGEFAADEVIVEVEASDIVAVAGPDFDQCGGILTLAATETDAGTGTWTTTDGGVVIENPSSHNSTVTGLTTGVYTFVWTLDNGACGITSDEVVVDYEATPIAVDDLLSVDFAGTNSLDVTTNDDTPGDYTITNFSTPTYGSISDLGNGVLEYTAFVNYAGEDSFTYTICSVDCPDECTEGTVRVTVGADALCTVPTIITPNNDGVNDEFIVPCLATDEYPNNIVSIFNEWGDEVFNASPYQNNWRGTYNGDDLPVGTYFYVIQFGNGEENQSGFIIIER